MKKNAFQVHSIDVEGSWKSSLEQSDQGNSWYFAEAWGINNRFRSPPMHCIAKHVTSDISYLMTNSIQTLKKTVTLDKKLLQTEDLKKLTLSLLVKTPSSQLVNPSVIILIALKKDEGGLTLSIKNH